MNVGAVLGGLVPRVDQVEGTRSGARLWTLTDTGQDYLRNTLGLVAPESGKAKVAPAASADVAELESLAASVIDADVHDYLEEAVRCLRAGARRAAVVFVWTGAVHTLREEVWAKGAPAVDAAIKRHRPKASDFKKQGVFSYVNDDTLLQIAEDLSVIDKSEKGQLKQALGLRNDCGPRAARLAHSASLWLSPLGM